jgi:RNA-directed DNA polymerase
VVWLAVPFAHSREKESRIAAAPVLMPTRSFSLDATTTELRAAFRSWQAPNDVARTLEVDWQLLTYILYRSPHLRYAEFEIPKRRGGTRTILRPTRDLAILQGKLRQVLEAVYRPRRCVRGFHPGTSIVKNAEPHVAAPVVLNVDLLDFFPSINFGRVRGLLAAPPYNRPTPVATLIAQISTVRDQLPQGAPTSPVLSNMVAASLDTRMTRIARAHGLVYTRYADDLTFSTSEPTLPSSIASRVGGRVVLGESLSAEVAAAGFRPNPAKLHLRGPSERQEVTGLVVNTRVNVPRTRIRQVRAMLHAWRKWGIERADAEFRSRYDIRRRSGAPAFKRVLRGRIDYIRMVRGQEDELYQRLHDQYCRLDPVWYGRRIKTKVEEIEDALWVIESPSGMFTATAFALEGIGIVTCAHALADDLVAYRAENTSVRLTARVIARDEEIDLAILALDAELPGQLRASSREPTMHQRIAVAGFPNHNIGDSPRIANGEIVQFRDRGGVRRFHVDATIIEGNSGGPVVDDKNHVVGVATTGITQNGPRETEAHGAIPISALRRLVPDPRAQDVTSSSRSE